jgi:hypothetical protein
LDTCIAREVQLRCDRFHFTHLHPLSSCGELTPIFADCLRVTQRAKPLNSSQVRDPHSACWNFKNDILRVTRWDLLSNQLCFDIPERRDNCENSCSASPIKEELPHFEISDVH